MQPVAFAPITPPMWSDRPVIVVGSGPSLKGFDFNRLKGLGYILAVKGALWDLPFADAAIGIDRTWMQAEAERIEAAAQTMPVFLTVKPEEYAQHQRRMPSAQFIELVRRGNCFQKTRVECGSTSGFAALNLAFIKGARVMVLFGFDYNDGGGHYDSNAYRHKLESINARLWPKWAKYFDGLIPDVESSGLTIINASPDSTITAFQKMTHEQALRFLQTWPR
jgi:hypothetical protein